ncbi:hypothetical protein DPN68_12220 [Flavobacterium tibetense]|jgi:hypothetical protein|uniref:Uncharacterized protein n=1 Tax=Flavobacterium tibetense TaxID=2233533 RepID=A0A365NYV4_9FLAO|nr:hypothetical protein DPN68_12220 [Flavobacterium tibetense]
MGFKKIGLFLFVIIMTNIIIHFELIPNIQISANSHSANEDYLEILTLLVAIISFAFSIYLIFFKKNKNGFLLLLFALNVALWIPKIFSINCKICSTV